MTDTRKAEVTFRIEADDPAHESGVTSETFDEISDGIAQLGGDNVEFRLMDTDE